MPTIINLNLLLAACEYSSVSAERKTNPKSELTSCMSDTLFSGLLVLQL